MGVDLFFVLSGFLVSGLLFREWKETGKLRIGRFLIRRGFKIYPAFYVMLAVVFCWKFPGWPYVARDALFVQNYFPSVFPHTWSLAVEEHFYLLLPLLLWGFRGEAKAPFRGLPILIGALAVTVLVLRFENLRDVDLLELAATDPMAMRGLFTPTHLRCDALFFGVFLSWMYCFRRSWFEALGRKSWLLLGAGLALLAPGFIFELGPHAWLLTVGFTVIYLGAGAILVAFHSQGWSFRPLAFVGFHSYSIYLWHIPVSYLVLPYLANKRTEPGLFLAYYLVVAIAVGIILTWLIEQPGLRLREKWFGNAKRGGEGRDAGEKAAAQPSSVAAA